MQRSIHNPLITPDMVKPSRPDFRVEGIFNCGVAERDGEVLLLCRVAEAVHCEDPDLLKVPIVTKRDCRDVIDVVSFVKSEHPELDFSDSRNVRRKDRPGKSLYLTSLSHLRLARSMDGIHFTVEDAPALMPSAEEESWGMEDPRITKIGEQWYINYTSVTAHGPATSLISTEDFIRFERHGVIFAPENKDVAIFPQKIGGSYLAFNRPVPCGIGAPDMWLAKSPDLLHWGEQRYFGGISENEDAWDNGRIGGGAVPFLTDQGWVVIYHAADRHDRYCLGAFLLEKDDPSHILGKTARPLLVPEEAYEREGFFGNVVFTCGCLVRGGEVWLYYGAADDKICRADFTVEEILAAIEPFDRA